VVSHLGINAAHIGTRNCERPPARQIGEWTIDLPKPRDEYVAELGTLRIEILTELRKAIPRRH